MNGFTACLLTLLFSLSGPAMGNYSDFSCSSLAANGEHTEQSIPLLLNLQPQTASIVWEPQAGWAMCGKGSVRAYMQKHLDVREAV